MNNLSLNLPLKHIINYLIIDFFLQIGLHPQKRVTTI